MNHHTRTCGLLMLVVAGLLAPAGCRAEYSSDADILRARVLDLETNVQRLERRNRELVSELRQARMRTQPSDLPADIAEHVPHVVGIDLGRLSHVRDRSGDGMPDSLLVYVQPVDSRGRFTQLVGELLVNVVVVPADAEAIRIGRARLTPAEVRDAYRSTLTGVHYTVDLPLELPDDVDSAWMVAQSAIVRVTFIDGMTGETRTAERSVSLSL